MSSNRNHAVVLGGSIAGLLAARVLADQYANVTIVERDRLPLGPEHRRGVSQSHHVHGLLPKGRMLVEELLPGLTDELVAAGALTGDVLANTRWVLNGRMPRQAESGLTAASASRPLIEGVIRRRVLALPNVAVLDGYDIVGVGASPDRRRVVSARITSVDGRGSRVVPADVVVDATGRGSRAPRWLIELGYEAPPEDRVAVDLWYATRLFEAPDGVLGDDIVAVSGRYLGQRRSGVMQRIEGGRLLVTLAGVLGERPPGELGQFLAYARSLPTPDLFDAARVSYPLGTARAYRCPTYVRRRYERLERFPEGLLVTGDAVCAINPVYAHGMTLAAIDAVALRDEVARGGSPDPYRFFDAVARGLDPAWGLAVSADLSLPGVTGPVLPASPITREYVAALQFAAAEDADVARTLVRVNTLVDPPSALVAPEIMERVRRAASALVGT